MDGHDAPDSSRGLSRRGLLAGAAAAGAAGALARVPSAGATEPDDASKTRTFPASTYFKEPALNFQMLSVVSAAAYGASETGKCSPPSTGSAPGRNDSPPSTTSSGSSATRRVPAVTRTARRGASPVPARTTCARRCTSTRPSSTCSPTSQPTRGHEGRAYGEMNAAWVLAMALLDVPARPVKIPFEGYDLPGWLLSPGGKSKRPTVIINNGSDAQNIDVYVSGGATTLERGWNALIFEGPGQGSNLFLHNRPFIPGWELVIASVVDFLRARPEVDKKRISLTGSSFGGYLTARAAAFEHRLAALVTDPGVTDSFYTWRTDLPKEILELLASGERDVFNKIWTEIPGQLKPDEAFGFRKRAEIYGNLGGYEQMKLAEKFVLTPELTKKIETPTAVCSPELEQFSPARPSSSSNG